ncbi:MAG: hypothetical protein Q8O86_11625 [Dehalococcoidia bacterium]|nr:hypothetical protein [Dehalococcoidia bacterium]
MDDSELFAVQNPRTGEMGYCCIMGALGTFFALAVYLGPEGLDSYITVRDCDEDGDDTYDATLDQKCLMVSFLDKSSQSKKDLDMVKALGLKLRGANAWPLFRSHLPGYHPWHLTADEADFLTLALDQSVEMAARVKAQPNLLETEGDGRMLVRIPGEAGGEISWKDEWITPELPAEGPLVSMPDEVSLKRMRSSLPSKPMTWEVDLFYLPSPVKEGDRPYYPTTLFCVDSASGFVFGIELMGPEERAEAPIKLCQFFEKAGFLPTQLAVIKEEILEMLSPLAQDLGLKVRRVKRWKKLDKAKLSLFETFKQRGIGF